MPNIHLRPCGYFKFMTAKELIVALDLTPHPEGGYYRETYRSGYSVANRSGNQRSVSTAIYFMLEGNDKSRFHRIKSDELWFFHQGQHIEILIIKNGNLETLILGDDITKGQLPQASIPADCWFAAWIPSGKGYGLVSCTVAPGFDFQDFELAEKDVLSSEFPHLKRVIENFT